MNIENFIQNVENTIEGVAQNSLKPETKFSLIPSWDSLSMLTLVAMIDSEYGVEINAQDIIKCATIEKLFNLISSKSTLNK